MVSVVVLRGAGADTQMLMACRVGPYLAGAWSYIAGHVQDGEAGWQTAQRELFEETGLTPERLYATSFCEQFYVSRPDGIELVPAFVARVADDAVVRLNAEHSAFRWLSLAEAAALVPFGGQRELIDHVRREFIEREPSAFLRLAAAVSSEH
ncbi:NUDIX domain-containing protein [Rhodanobacter sp. AS-Z3]|uniref:NUDIX hydrolase n=1 Tax=Rhodanobacter sp. AS-Z3 TaxID=3031330 RepID=UPI00247A9902|nr:NUDIX domain-containing protein [Rhodanobacter sp. AS-Z3]WEN16847.1 NUDIX domain-containing protein [Rhodanobacter sp. AS-Z3]